MTKRRNSWLFVLLSWIVVLWANAGATQELRGFPLRSVSESCSHAELIVEGAQGSALVRFGNSATIPVTGGEVVWFCGSSRAQTGRTMCPPDTRTVVVRRTESPRFYLDCWR